MVCQCHWHTSMAYVNVIDIRQWHTSMSIVCQCDIRWYVNVIDIRQCRDRMSMSLTYVNVIDIRSRSTMSMSLFIILFVQQRILPKSLSVFYIFSPLIELLFSFCPLSLPQEICIFRSQYFRKPAHFPHLTFFHHWSRFSSLCIWHFSPIDRDFFFRFPPFPPSGHLYSTIAMFLETGAPEGASRGPFLCVECI